MSDELHSSPDTQMFEESLRKLAEEFVFSVPQSSDVSSATPETADEKLYTTWLKGPITLEGSYPQTCLTITFRDKNQPKQLFGYKWPIWLGYTNESVRDLAVYFSTHLSELFGAYDTGCLRADSELSAASDRELVTWLSFNEPR